MSRSPARGSGRVIVVGSGAAGLAAAHALESRGSEVVVVPTGDASEDAVRAPDTWSDAELLPTPHPTLDGLARDAGVDRGPEWPLERVVELERGRARELTLRGGGLLGVGRARPLLDAWRRARLASLARWFEPLADAAEPERGTRLDDRSLLDFARVYLGHRPARSALEALCALGPGLDVTDTSRLLLFRWIDKGGIEKGKGDRDARLALSVWGGAPGLLEALAKQLRDLRVGVRARGITGDGRRVELEDGSTLEGDAVVIACAASSAERLVPDLAPLEHEACTRATSHARVVLSIGCDDDPLYGAPLAWVPRSQGGICAGVLRAAHDTWLLVARPETRALEASDDASLRDALLRDTERVLPGLRAHAQPLQIRRVQRARFDVGHYRRIAGLRLEERRRFAARPIAYCGDWTLAPDLEATLHSGQRAADLILNAD